GVFVRNGVAVAHLMQFVHTLKNNNGKHLGVVANLHLRGYLPAFHTDSVLIETSPYRKPPGYWMSLRYAIGNKSATWWSWYNIGKLLDAHQVSKADLQSALRGLADYTALRSFYMGINYGWFQAAGVQYLVRLDPLMKQLNKA